MTEDPATIRSGSAAADGAWTTSRGRFRSCARASRLHAFSLVTAKLVQLDHGADGPTLAPDVDVHAFADACRAAGLALLEGAQHGWGKRELAAWLTGPYARVSAALGVPAPSSRVPETSPAHSSGIVRSGAVEELLDLVRIAVSSALKDLSVGETSCVTETIRSQSIVSGRDARGLVWMPADRPRMRLEARVLSLFVVDYLLRPEPYEKELAVCGDCDAVSFDGAGRSCAICNDRGHPSHVRATSTAPGILKSIKSAG